MKKTTTILVMLSIICFQARSQNAPVTSAPFITDAAPGTVSVNISVSDFNAIGAFSLTLLYDPLVLTYQDAYPNVALNPANFSVSSSPAPGGKYQLSISYPYGHPSVTLADGSVLVLLEFTFTVDNQVNHSELTWYDDGTSCEYTDATNAILNDSPAEDYYIDGLAACQVAPVTYLPSATYYETGPIQVPVTVNDFDQIGSIALTFEYDPSVLTYDGTFSTSITGLGVNDLASAGGMRKIVIGWFGDPLTLPDGSGIVELDFTYHMGTCALEWLDNGISCEYTDAMYYTLWDSPTETYYNDGMTMQQMAPVVKADTAAGYMGDLLAVGVRTWDFDNINSMVLTLDYNTTNLSFECATPTPCLTGTFDAVDNGPGQIVITWTDPSGLSITDGCIIFYLAFTYQTGTNPLTWNDAGTTCEFTTGPSFTPLNDLPTVDFYYDGMAEAGPGPAVWTGGISFDWEDASNWQDGQLPESHLDVLITSANTPTYWPKYTGDLTLGDQCRDITLQGSAQLTVTSDVTIDAGRKIEVQDNATIKTSGDWINNGLFEPGSGTVEFFGDKEGVLPSDVSPGDFLSNLSWEAFTVGMTDLVGGMAGPSGDDSHMDVPIGFSFRYLGNTYTQVRLNTNGWISFDLSGEDGSSMDNTRMFFTEAPTTAVAPWWDNLQADGSSSIFYLTEGTTPNRVFTAEWNSILSYANDATARLNFQVKLYETSNVIEFHYGDVVGDTHSDDEGASIGLKGTTGGAGDFMEGTTGSSSNVITCHESSVTGWPMENYRFTPPPNTDKEIFWKIYVTKIGSARLNITRDTHVMGVNP